MRLAVPPPPESTELCYVVQVPSSGENLYFPSRQSAVLYMVEQTDVELHLFQSEPADYCHCCGRGSRERVKWHMGTLRF